MFRGLSAFAYTPMHGDEVDEAAFRRIVARLARSGVDSVGVLGSTGNAAYLTTAQRERVAHVAVEDAGEMPVIVGVSALATRDVLINVAAAQRAGAHAVMLLPMAYQPLTEREVVGLYRAATEASELPVIVYDNPRTSSFRFSLETYAAVAALPGIASIKIPGVPEGLEQARDHVAAIRAEVPEHVTIGVSGDHLAALGLLAGCDAWYSVVAGIFPEVALRILAAARSQSVEATMAEVAVLEPLFDLFAECQGSVRVIAALAEHMGLASAESLPAPLMGLSAEPRNAAASIANGLDLTLA